MIYVFDDDEEMGECCGCPLSPAGLESFSVKHDLTSNFIFGNNPDANGVGSIAVVATGSNTDYVSAGPSNGHNCPITQSGACYAGCDPTTQPGYPVTPANNLLGGITHNQQVGFDGGATVGLTEIPLFDDAGGDPNNLVYLQNECFPLVIMPLAAACNCPVIPPPPTSPTPTATPTPTRDRDSVADADRNAYSDADADRDSDRDRNSDRDADADRNAYSDGDPDCDGYSDPDADAYSDPDGDRDANTYPTPTATATNTATPTVTPTPAVPAPQSGNSNNTPDGDVGIGVSAGGASTTLNSLVVLTIDVFAEHQRNVPHGNAANDEWDNKSCVTLITSTPVGSSPVKMVQYIYWHIIGSGETGFGGPSFNFAFTGDGTPANCHTANTAGCFRATGVGINYNGTCTEDTPSPCPLTDAGVVTAGKQIWHHNRNLDG